MVELTAYNDLPHLITPVITEPKMASQALKWVVEKWKIVIEDLLKTEVEILNHSTKMSL